MAGETFIGCCGWTEAQGRYVQDFRTIELQTTFYQPPSTRVAERWKSQAPEGFRFCMKAWQLITHTPSSPTYRRLKEAVSPREAEWYGNFRPTEQTHLAWERTREIAAIVDARVIVFQCPKSFLPTRENVRNMREFFHGIERDGRACGWEPRGEAWAPELVREICASNDLIHVVDPFRNEANFGDSIYWRLHGIGGYRYRYTDEDLVELRARLRRRSARVAGPNYVMFNNIYSLQDSQRFLAIKPGRRTRAFP